MLRREWPDLFTEATTAPAEDVGPGPAATAPPDRSDLEAQLQEAKREIEQLREALASNREIGAACGVIMTRQHLTQQAAFQLLRSASQSSGRKLSEVAGDVLFTGLLPVKPRPRPPAARGPAQRSRA